MTGQFVADHGEASGIAFSHDGAVLAASGNNSQRSSIVLADARTWTPVGEPLVVQGSGRRSFPDRVDALVFSDNDSRLFSGDLDNHLIEWDIAARRQVKVLAGHADDVLAVRILAGGSVISTGADGVVVLWNPANGQWGADALDREADGTQSVAFLGRTALLTATSGGRVLIWDATKRTPIRQLTDGTDPFGHFYVAAAGGSRVATVDMSGSFLFYDTTDGRVIHRYAVAGPTNVDGLTLQPGQPLAIDATGRTMAVALGRQLTVVDVGSGAALLDVADATGSVAISPDGQRVAALLPGGVLRLWQRLGGAFSTHSTELAIGDSPRLDSVLTFSPDGRTLAVALGTTIRMVHLDKGGGHVDMLEGHLERATALAFSPDGTLLATGGADGVVLLWDLPSGRRLGTLRAGTTAITGLAFSEDGTRLATAGERPVLQVDENGMARPPTVSPAVLLWNLDVSSWSAHACEVAGRNLSKAEWVRYLGTDLPYKSTCPQFAAGS
jgi:WD40 repeat protein